MSPEGDELERKEHPAREGDPGERGLGFDGASCLILRTLAMSTLSSLMDGSLHCRKPSVTSTSTQSSGTNVLGRTSQERVVCQALGHSSGHEASRARGQRETEWKRGARSTLGTCRNLPENLPGSRPSHRILEAVHPVLFLSQTI